MFGLVRSFGSTEKFRVALITVGSTPVLTVTLVYNAQKQAKTVHRPKFERLR